MLTWVSQLSTAFISDSHWFGLPKAPMMPQQNVQLIKNHTSSYYRLTGRDQVCLESSLGWYEPNQNPWLKILTKLHIVIIVSGYQNCICSRQEIMQIVFSLGEEFGRRIILPYLILSFCHHSWLSFYLIIILYLTL